MTGQWRVDLPWTRPPLSLNDRLYWRAEHRIKQGIASDVRTMARYHRIPHGLERVEIVLHWQPNTRRRRDSDNPAPTLKAAIDALVAYGLVADDSSERVTSQCVIAPVLPNLRSAVWLVITDKSEAAA